MSEASDVPHMAADCIFCRIVDGDVPARVVYEDEDVLAFLDANPLARGHTLVIPKAHHETLADLPAEAGRAVMGTLHRLAPAVEDAVGADGSTVAFNNGEAAGQEVPHVHGHVVPRSESDGGRPIHALFGSRPDLDDADLDAVAADIEERV
jgi:histidine triad (HIT) family protein